MAPRISTRLPMYFDRSFLPPSSTTVEPPAKMVSGLRPALVTTSSGWPDADAGCGSSWTHPVTTTVLGFFDCAAAVAAIQTRCGNDNDFRWPHLYLRATTSI